MTAPFDALLQVQGHDTRLDQLRHQLEALPAREERNAARNALAVVEADIAAHDNDRAVLAKDQRRLEDDIELVNEKRKHVEGRLYGGTVTNARELQDLQEELDALGRRVSQLEDQDLEIMGQIEPIDAALAELAILRGQRAAVLEDAEVRLTAAEAELQVALEAEVAERAAAAAEVNEALLTEYEALRAGRGGIGVARLVGTQCGGCHLTLSAVEAARIRKLGQGEITHCEECGRLLVP
jgi:predicted  nucleic acid-binding Zn-ribbon protein